MATPPQPNAPGKSFDAEMLRLLSRERLHPYQATADNGDRRIALARYLRNAALSAAITPALHALEVALRNALYANIESLAHRERWLTGRSYPDVPSWLDYRTTLLHGKGVEIVDAAKASHAKNQRKRRRAQQKRLTTGHLIAELTFGFWVSLVDPMYESRRDPDKMVLWPGLTPAVFPGEQRYDVIKKRVLPQLLELVDLRNRVAHYEPIWQLDLPKLWLSAVTILGYISPEAEQLVRDTDRFAHVYADFDLAFLPAIRHY